MKRHSRGAGFTLIELLVVMAIIGILVGLLLPAVQMVREAGRRTACSNNIRQLGLAIMNYESSNKVLPPGWVEPGFGDPTVPLGSFRWGWATKILPFLEGNNLYDDYRVADYPLWMDVSSSTPADPYFDPTSNKSLHDVVMEIFMCPSDALSEFNKNVPIMTSNRGTMLTQKMNYGGSCGVDAYVCGPLGTPDPSGVFNVNSRVKWKHVTDGQSNTVLLGERGGTWHETATQPNVLIRPGITALVPNQLDFGVGNQLNQGPYDITGFQTIPGFEPELFNINASELAYKYGFASAHPVGCHMVFCDGSTRFVSESLDETVFALILHKADGQVVDADDL